MQAIDMSRVDGAEGEPSLQLKPINIACVRAASLHASGLRAAARLTSRILMGEDVDAPKENLMRNTGEKMVTASNQSCSSSVACISSSTKLSYTNSQEPGEDSQLNAFVMVDKLVSMNVGFAFESPEQKLADVQSSLKAPQCVSSLPSLARNAGMKDVQDQIGVYDWVDSQSNKDAEVLPPLQRKQAQTSKVMNRKEKPQKFEGTNENESVRIEKVDPLVKQSTFKKPTSNSVSDPHNLTAQSESTEDNGTQAQKFHARDLSRKIQEVNCCVTHEAHSEGTENDLEEAMIMRSPDIGAATQIALEAIDMMRCGIELNEQGIPPNDRDTPALCNFGDNTQMALDAIDIMRHGSDVETGFRENKNCWKHSRGKRHDAEQSVKPIINGDRKWSLPSSLPTSNRATGNGRASRRISRTPRRQEPDCSKQVDVIAANGKKRFLLDFSSAVVPRSKRSRLSVPRGPPNENAMTTLRQDHKSHLLDKLDSLSENKSLKDGSLSLDPKQKDDVSYTRSGLLTKSTNGEDLRQTKAMEWYSWFEPPRKSRKRESSSIQVFFSNGLSDTTIKHQKKMLAKLGGRLATSVADSTHFIADSFVRTRNMLESMAAGKEIVTTSWLEDCSHAEYFVNEKSYILQDDKKERELGFCMQSSLAAARRKPLLEGLKFMVSPNTFPDFETLKAIIEGAGGQAVQKVPFDPSDTAKHITVIASEKDREFCAEFLVKGCKVYSTEFILQGVVTQSLDFSRNHLFEEHLH